MIVRLLAIVNSVFDLKSESTAIKCRVVVVLQQTTSTTRCQPNLATPGFTLQFRGHWHRSLLFVSGRNTSKTSSQKRNEKRVQALQGHEHVLKCFAEDYEGKGAGQKGIIDEQVATSRHASVTVTLPSSTVAETSQDLLQLGMSGVQVETSNIPINQVNQLELNHLLPLFHIFHTRLLIQTWNLVRA
ncbi:hypothetical protein BDN72DRAFT_941907 [Pluteus cervinus]|uniref:Uncharacterized protein n=1 Tax=Pluteus cervinus TaxID=181527 RepID=A0ACD3A2V2_9AGAR|nr:hypothetical protein BDN72DRAFT_941907 [Pluteus cervinus]